MILIENSDSLSHQMNMILLRGRRPELPVYLLFFIKGLINRNYSLFHIKYFIDTYEIKANNNSKIINKTNATAFLDAFVKVSIFIYIIFGIKYIII